MTIDAQVVKLSRRRYFYSFKCETTQKIGFGSYQQVIEALRKVGVEAGGEWTR